MPGGHSEWEPPDLIPNSEVKTLSADGSVGSPHVRVGHCQAFLKNPLSIIRQGVFFEKETTNYADTCAFHDYSAVFARTDATTD